MTSFPNVVRYEDEARGLPDADVGARGAAAACPGLPLSVHGRAALAAADADAARADAARANAPAPGSGGSGAAQAVVAGAEVAESAASASQLNAYSQDECSEVYNKQLKAGESIEVYNNQLKADDTCLNPVDRRVSVTLKASGNIELFIHDLGDGLVPIFDSDELEVYYTIDAETVSAYKISIEGIRKGAKTHKGDMGKWLYSKGLNQGTDFTKFICG